MPFLRPGVTLYNLRKESEMLAKISRILNEELPDDEKKKQSIQMEKEPKKG